MSKWKEGIDMYRCLFFWGKESISFITCFLKDSLKKNEKLWLLGDRII